MPSIFFKLCLSILKKVRFGSFVSAAKFLIFWHSLIVTISNELILPSSSISLSWSLLFKFIFFSSGRFSNPLVEVIPEKLTWMPNNFSNPAIWLKSNNPLQFLIPKYSKLSKPSIPERFFNSGLSINNNFFNFFNAF